MCAIDTLSTKFRRKSSAFTSHSTDSELRSNHHSLVCSYLVSVYCCLSVCVFVYCLYFQFSPSEVYAVLYSFRKLSDSWRRCRIECVHINTPPIVTFIQASFHSLPIMLSFRALLLSSSFCHSIQFYLIFQNVSVCLPKKKRRKKTIFYFPIVWHVPFSKQIFKLFSSLLFEQCANMKSMWNICVCSGQRAKWYSYWQSPEGNKLFGFFCCSSLCTILTWNWSILVLYSRCYRCR